MSEHTKEPWYVSREGGGVRIMADDAEGRFTIADIVLGDECEANARRIVACVDACHNIDTDTLEVVAECGGISGRKLGKIRSERDKIKQQRDELLEAMERISRFDKYEPAGPAARTAIEAIAKIRGES